MPKQPAVITFADLLRQARLDKDLSQRDLARELGVSQGAIHGWEAGKSRPDLGRLPLMSEVLGIDIGVLATAAAAA